MVDPTVSAAGMRVMKLLVGRPPQTLAELIDATGVTRTAVTEQLNELVAAGLVERGTERLPGRGRPRHVYKASSASLLLLFAHSQSLVVPAIWKAIDEMGGDELTRDVVSRVGLHLADHYKRRITARSPEERLRQLTGLLRDEGGLVEAVYKDGKLLMRKGSCPFISMIDEKRIVCCVDLEMMSEVVGRPVRLVACRHEGDPCCIAEIATAEDHEERLPKLPELLHEEGGLIQLAKEDVFDDELVDEDFDFGATLPLPPAPAQRIKAKLRFIGRQLPTIHVDPGFDFEVEDDEKADA